MASNEEYIRRNKVVIVDDDGNTKLHYAAALNNLEEIDKIVASGQKLDPENYLGWTPLMMAVRNANSMAINILLEKGPANATKKNKFGMNVFLISVACGDVDIVAKILNHLLSGGVSRQSIQKTFSPVSLAILFGQSHIFKYLLERNFDPNATTPLTGITPAMFAAAMGNNKAIKKLLQYKADLTKRNHLGQTASDILHPRHQKIDVGSTNLQKPPHVPIIIVSPHSNTPMMQLTPLPIIHGQGYTKKSSNTQTPNMCTPNLTPITPQMVPQVFFGSDFTPSQFISPMGAFQNSGFLNANISPSSVFVSPVPQQPMCHPNCC